MEATKKCDFTKLSQGRIRMMLKTADELKLRAESLRESGSAAVRGTSTEREGAATDLQG